MKFYLNHILLLAGLVFIVVMIFFLNSPSNTKEKQALDETNQTVQSFAATTKTRVNEAIITVPDLKDVLTGLSNGEGTFKSDAERTGTIKLGETVLTKFVPGALGGKKPRLDLVAPMYVDYGDGTIYVYVVLFQDSGKVAIEKSYAYLGRTSKINDVSTVDPDSTNYPKEEYEVKVDYLARQKGDPVTAVPVNHHDVFIPVEDGHFVPDRTIVK